MTILLLAALAQLATTSPQIQPAGGLATAWGFTPFYTIWTDYINQSLRFEDTIAYFNGRKMKYVLNNDSIVMYTPISWHDTDDSASQDEIGGYSFVLAHRDTDSIVLRPYRNTQITPVAHGLEDDYLFDTTSTITLYNPVRFIDTNLSFNRLLYHTCDKSEELDIEFINGEGRVHIPSHGKKVNHEKWMIIDNTKHLYFYGNNYAMKIYCIEKYHDNAHVLKPGYYQGLLDDTLYQSLIGFLKFCNVGKLSMRKNSASSIIITCEIYYNNSYRKLEGAEPSILGGPLFSEIERLLFTIPLTKSTTAEKMFNNFNK